MGTLNGSQRARTEVMREQSEQMIFNIGKNKDQSRTDQPQTEQEPSRKVEAQTLERWRQASDRSKSAAIPLSRVVDLSDADDAPVRPAWTVNVVPNGGAAPTTPPMEELLEGNSVRKLAPQFVSNSQTVQQQLGASSSKSFSFSGGSHSSGANSSVSNSGAGATGATGGAWGVKAPTSQSGGHSSPQQSTTQAQGTFSQQTLGAGAPHLSIASRQQQKPSIEDELRARYGTDVKSALGPGTVIEGKFSFDTPVRIDGTLKGEVVATSVLIVGEQAVVEASVTVGSLVVLGRVEGDVVAEDLVEIKATGTLEGDISTERLMVEEGGVFRGRCNV